MRRTTGVAVALVALFATAFAPAVTVTPSLLGEPSSTSTPTATIVVLRDSVDVAAAVQRLLTPHGLAPRHVYTNAVAGFSVEAPPHVVAAIAADPAVASVEADRAVRTAAQVTPRGVERIDADHAAGVGAGRDLGVDVAIIDTGIASHADLRVHERVDCTDKGIEPTVEYVTYLLTDNCKSGGTDTDGHGTHVAGIVGARDNSSGVVGVAPGARLWSVRVLTATDNGSLQDVIAGVDHVALHADEIEVANISLVAEGRSDAMDAAIEGATDAGIAVVVAAGNDSASASNVTPANSPDAITVSAVTDLDGRPGARKSCSSGCLGGDDRFASYSNHGADIAAPGSYILSTSRDGKTATLSGTSMAAPHVAGAAALRIQQLGLAKGPNRAQRALDDLLSTSARENTSCGYRGSPTNEKLLDLRSGC